MATLRVDGQDLVLELSHAEHVEGVHRDLRAPLACVVDVAVLDDAHAAADAVGVKIGTRIPGVIAVGTIVGRHGRLFAAVHRTTPRGVRVTLTGADHDQWVVGCDDPEAVVAAIDAGRQASGS